MARLGIDAVIEPAAERRPQFTCGRVRRLGEFPLDIEDGDVEKTHGDFRPADTIQPGGVEMDGARGPWGSAVTALPSETARVSMASCSKRAADPCREGKGEDPEEKNKSVSFPFHDSPIINVLLIY